jgi:hypothetical protein
MAFARMGAVLVEKIQKGWIAGIPARDCLKQGEPRAKLWELWQTEIIGVKCFIPIVFNK